MAIVFGAALFAPALSAEIPHPGVGPLNRPTSRSAVAMQERGSLRGGSARGTFVATFRLGPTAGRVAWIGPKGNREWVCWDASASQSRDADVGSGLSQGNLPSLPDLPRYVADRLPPQGGVRGYAGGGRHQEMCGGAVGPDSAGDGDGLPSRAQGGPPYWTSGARRGARRNPGEPEEEEPRP